jgi:DUF971 family protein
MPDRNQAASDLPAAGSRLRGWRPLPVALRISAGVFAVRRSARSRSRPGVLVTGKEAVNISAIEPVGNYAVKLVFDDGHSTGLYSWNVLHDLGANQESNWQDYLRRLAEAGYQRQV